MKPFDLENIIKERVDRESEIEHAYDPSPKLPKYIPSKAQKSVGWMSFLIGELMP